MFIQPAVQIYILAFFCSNLKEQNNEQLSVFYMSSFMKCFHHKNFCLLVWETPWNLLKLYTFWQMLSQYNHACMIVRLQMKQWVCEISKHPYLAVLSVCATAARTFWCTDYQEKACFLFSIMKKKLKKKLWQKKDSAT